MQLLDADLETRYGILDRLCSDSRFGFFQRDKGGPICGWTTEKRGGWWYSFRATPVGPGARSGQSSTYKVRGASVVRHRKRKDAQARARKLLRQGVPVPPR